MSKNSVKIRRYIVVFSVLLMSLIACQENYTPKSRGYCRIDLPDHLYQPFDTNFPYTFEYSKSAMVVTESERFRAPYWMNINYPDFNGTVYISYLPVNNNLTQLMEDSRTFVMKLIPKVNAIDERVVLSRQNNVYGIIYEIAGVDAASTYQFFLTDSVNNFVRGSLYFNNVPNNDSLQPVISFIREDMEHLIRTFQWKEN